jgi:hypothetical protein
MPLAGIQSGEGGTMARIFLSIMFLLALSAMVTAQTQSGESSKAGSTITGCLSGPNNAGAYMLKTASGSVEVGGSDELKQHVGHEVKLSGTWAASGSQIGEREENEKSSSSAKHEEAESSARESHEKGEASERHFSVSSVTMVSDSCSATNKK